MDPADMSALDHLIELINVCINFFKFPISFLGFTFSFYDIFIGSSVILFAFIVVKRLIGGDD